MCKLFKKVEFRSYELGNSMLFAENTQGKNIFYAISVNTENTTKEIDDLENTS